MASSELIEGYWKENSPLGSLFHNVSSNLLLGAHSSHSCILDIYLQLSSTILQHDSCILMFLPSVPVLLSRTMKHKLPIKMIILLLVLKVKSNYVENMWWCDI